MSTTEENTLAALLEEPVIFTLELEKPEDKPKPKIYAHINVDRGKIVSVTPVQQADEGIEVVELEYDLGIKFLRGAENITKWVAMKDENNKFFIMKKSEAERQRPKLHRIKDLPIYELTMDYAEADTRVEVGDPNVVKIHYRGDKIGSWNHPVILYFTSEGDPTHLKGVLSLDVNTLNEIQALNQLPEWPNPIELPLNRADDVSVYVIRSSQLKVAIVRNEASSN